MHYIASMLALVVVRGPDTGRTFPLPPYEPQLVGRSSEALHLSDACMSRCHAELTPDGSDWSLRDLSSRHGTFLNGERILGAVTLHAGDRFRCGDTEFLAIREGAVPPRTHDDGIAQAARVDDAVTMDASSEAATITLTLIARAAEPTDADAYLAEAARVLESRLKSPITALRALDADLDSFVAPSHELPDDAHTRGTPHASFALVRRAILQGDMLQADTLTLIAPFGAIGGMRGAFLLERPCNTAATSREIACLARACDVTTLALAARKERDIQASQHRLALIGETVAALSHSIKNMLQGMRFGADAVDMALTHGELAKAQEGWPILQRNLDRIHALALNMLAWAKERPLELELSNANELAREVCELLTPAALRRRVQVTLALDDALPATSIDGPSIHQALTNLVLNAIEAAPERTGRVTIGSRYDNARNEVTLTVTDNGAGIPDSIRARLFEPFASSKGQRGTGLGLAVAQKISLRHGGRLDVISSATNGTLFELTLPAGGENLDPAETRAPKALRPGEFGWKFE